jgi:hypothetical protein
VVADLGSSDETMTVRQQGELVVEEQHPARSAAGTRGDSSDLTTTPYFLCLA